jgi:hypothetical protein
MTDLSGRYQLTEAASHFLHTSFQHLATSLRLECAGIIFGREIQSIDPPDDWEGPDLFNSESDPLDVDEEVLPEETIDKLAGAWEDAQNRALSGEVTVPIDHTIRRVEIASHILNLYSVVETVINRHLYAEKEAGRLDEGVYQSMDRARLLSKMAYVFKEEISSGEFRLDRFKHLNTLRNAAVHYRSESRDRLMPTVKELTYIWRNVGEMLELLGGEPTKEELEELYHSALDQYVD